MKVVLMETYQADFSVEWGVSLTSHNPDPDDYLRCDDRQEAVSLSLRLQRVNCPRCRSHDVAAPSPRRPDFVCRACEFPFHSGTVTDEVLMKRGVPREQLPDRHA